MATEVTFGFDVDEKVELCGGLKGKVKAFWLGRGSVKRIEVSYVDKNGVVREDWFDEHDLSRQA